MSSKSSRLWIDLLGLDLLGATLAFLCTYWLGIAANVIHYCGSGFAGEHLKLYLYSIPMLFVAFRMADLYDKQNVAHGTTEEYTRVMKGCIFLVFGLVLLSFAVHGFSPSRSWLVAVWVLCFFFISFNRFVFRYLMRRRCRAGAPLEKALILGASEESKAIAQRLELGGLVEVVGFLDDFSPRGGEVWKNKVVLGPSRSYRDIAHETGANLAVLVPDANSWESQRDVLGQAAVHNDVELQIAPGLSDFHLVSMKVSFQGNVPLLRFRPGYITGLDSVLKYLMDLLTGLVLLVISAPTMVVLGVLLWFEGGWPVIESINVMGKNGRPFHTHKFRTGMALSYRSFRRRVPLTGINMKIRPIERFLFVTGLDKLPQIFDVLTGKMSIVGPRTLTPEVIRQYGQWIQSILAVKPGFTGNWALNNSRDLEQEISLTLHYVRNWNIWTDLGIILQTVYEAFRTRFRTRLETDQEAEQVLS